MSTKPPYVPPDKFSTTASMNLAFSARRCQYDEKKKRKTSDYPFLEELSLRKMMVTDESLEFLTVSFPGFKPKSKSHDLIYMCDSVWSSATPTKHKYPAAASTPDLDSSPAPPAEAPGAASLETSNMPSKPSSRPRAPAPFPPSPALSNSAASTGTWQDWTVEVTGLVRRRKEQNMVKQTIGFNWGPAGVSNYMINQPHVQVHFFMEKAFAMAASHDKAT